MDPVTVKRVIALMIGIGTIVTGVFTWRAGQIGSAAAFDDRQAIGEQVDVENARIDVSIEAARQAREYDRYLSDYEVALALDADADALAAAGEDELSAIARNEATALREAATVRAANSGVLGPSTLARDPEFVASEPLPFDLEERIEQLTQQEVTGLDSAGDLDPQQWADDADAIRDRIRNLTYWVLVLFLAIVSLTVAEVTISRRLRWSGLGVGVVLIFIGGLGGLTSGYFA